MPGFLVDVEVHLHPGQGVAHRHARLGALLRAELARLPQHRLADHQPGGAGGRHAAGRPGAPGAARRVVEAARLRLLAPLDAVVAPHLVRPDVDLGTVRLLEAAGGTSSAVRQTSSRDLQPAPVGGLQAEERVLRVREVEPALGIAPIPADLVLHEEVDALLHPGEVFLRDLRGARVGDHALAVPVDLLLREGVGDRVVARVDRHQEDRDVVGPLERLLPHVGERLLELRVPRRDAGLQQRERGERGRPERAAPAPAAARPRPVLVLVDQEPVRAADDRLLDPATELRGVRRVGELLLVLAELGDRGGPRRGERREAAERTEQEAGGEARRLHVRRIPASTPRRDAPSRNAAGRAAHGGVRRRGRSGRPPPEARGYPSSGRASAMPVRTLSALLASAAFSAVSSDQLDDLAHAAAAERHGHAQVDVLEAVLALEVGARGHDAAGVAEDRLDHHGRAGRGRVVGAPGAEQLDDLGAAVAGPVGDLRDRLGRQELGERDAVDRAVARERDHRVAVPAEDHRSHVLRRALELHADEGGEAGAVEHAGHADHAPLREARHVVDDPRHHVEGVRDHDDDGVGRVRADALAPRPSRCRRSS